MFARAHCTSTYTKPNLDGAVAGTVEGGLTLQPIDPVRKIFVSGDVGIGAEIRLRFCESLVLHRPPPCSARPPVLGLTCYWNALLISDN
jgi:hypothetical protein